MIGKACFRLLAVILLLAGTPALAQPVPVGPGQGLDLYQIDLTYPLAPQPHSQVGLAVINPVELLNLPGFSGSIGFLNVLSHDWVIRNMPVDMGMVDGGYGGLSAMFDLGVLPGTEVSLLDVEASLSPFPVDQVPFGGGGLFPVSPIEHNAEGGGLSPRDLLSNHQINHNGITFDPSSPDTFTVWQPGHANIEQAKNQCAPAAVANSLQYLENRFGVDVPHDNNPGGNGVRDGTLVGELGDEMNRPANGTTSLANWRAGKVRYMDSNGLGNLKLKSYGFSGDFTQGTTVMDEQSDSSGLSIIDWILRELQDGEDVELFIDWDGERVGHVVEVVGGGKILGVPWLAWAHDFKQGDNSTGTGADEGGLGWSLVDPATGRAKNYVGFGDGATKPIRDGRITHAMSQSIPEPSALVLLAMGALGMLAYLRCRRKRI